MLYCSQKFVHFSKIFPKVSYYNFFERTIMPKHPTHYVFTDNKFIWEMKFSAISSFQLRLKCFLEIYLPADDCLALGLKLRGRSSRVGSRYHLKISRPEWLYPLNLLTCVKFTKHCGWQQNVYRKQHIKNRLQPARMQRNGIIVFFTDIRFTKPLRKIWLREIRHRVQNFLNLQLKFWFRSQKCQRLSIFPTNLTHADCPWCKFLISNIFVQNFCQLLCFCINWMRARVVKS